MPRRANRSVLMVLGACLLLLPAVAPAAEARKPRRRVHPALRQVEEVSGLPRVLLIGDSISMGYTVPVRELLKGKANVHHPPANCGPTTRGLERLGDWLGTKRWAVIHFNFGLHDLKYVDERGRRVPPGKGRQQVPIERYRENLERILKRLQTTGATLIWATTTPVPEGAQGRVPGDAARYNAVAAKVMKARGVAVNDLYGFARERLETIQRPKNVHFTPEGSKALARRVAASILKALERR